MLVIHIGTHKTGSSALQSFTAHRVDALREKGVRYLKAGRDERNAHHKLSWALRDRDDVPMTVWKTLRAELADSGAAIDLVSSEAFWFTDPAAVKDALGPVRDVRIVMYLRRQDKYLQSLYKQTVAGGRKLDFDAWFEKFSHRGDYLPVVRGWADAFGPGAVQIRPYERGGKTINIIDDFYGALGVDVAQEIAAMKPRRFNPSPRVELLHLIRAVNQLDLDIDRADFFFSLVKGRPDYVRSGDILDFERCLGLMAKFEDGNREILAKYYQSAADPLFPEMTRGEAPHIWKPDDAEFFAMTTDVLATLVRIACGEPAGKKALRDA